MITNSTNLEIDWAVAIEAEILNDEKNEWWWPKSNEHDIFEAAYMKFLNGNLNYFHFGNMVASVLEGDRFNENFPKTLEFCNYSRSLTGDTGPYGRMCVWKLPPKKYLKLHLDDFTYHKQIVRNIFVVSNHNSGNSKIIINQRSIPFTQGTLFQFYPAVEYHAFFNATNTDFYFLGYDFWIPECLEKSIKEIGDDVYALKENQERLTMFGGGVNKCLKFMSPH